jgi:hypothetical protein
MGEMKPIFNKGQGRGPLDPTPSYIPPRVAARCDSGAGSICSCESIQASLIGHTYPFLINALCRLYNLH